MVPTTLASQRVAYTLTELTSALALALGGRQMAAGVGYGAVRLWDVATGAEQLTLEPHPAR